MTLTSRMKEILAADGTAIRAAALALGCSAGHLSRVLRGLRHPSKKLIQAFQRLARRHDLERLVHERRKGRPRRGGNVAEVRRAFGVSAPTRLTQPLRTAFRLACYTPAGREMVEELDRLDRPGSFWKPVKWLAGLMNGPEQALLMNLLLSGGNPKELHPRHVAFPLPVLERPGHWWLALVLPAEGLLVVAFPQLEVCTHKFGYRRLDFMLAVAAPDGTGIHRNVEVDGPPHRGRQAADRARGEEIGLGTLRLTAEQAYDRATPGKLLEWLGEQVHLQRPSRAATR